MNSMKDLPTMTQQFNNPWMNTSTTGAESNLGQPFHFANQPSNLYANSQVKSPHEQEDLSGQLRSAKMTATRKMTHDYRLHQNPISLSYLAFEAKKLGGAREEEGSESDSVEGNQEQVITTDEQEKIY